MDIKCKPNLTIIKAPIHQTFNALTFRNQVSRHGRNIQESPKLFGIKSKKDGI
jgi:hypothetical protein